MDRIRLTNNVTYPIEQIEVSRDSMKITFRKTVDSATVDTRYLKTIRIEDRKGNLLGRYENFTTVIKRSLNYLLLRRIIYSDSQLAAQAATDADLCTYESQQSITDLDVESLVMQQADTDNDIDSIETQQDLTDVDVGQIEQGQTITETELELLSMEV